MKNYQLAALSFFAKRVDVIATIHQKEKASALLLEQELGIQTVLPANFNNAFWETFNREIKRQTTQENLKKIPSLFAFTAKMG